jgi:hypothetical protein
MERSHVRHLQLAQATAVEATDHNMRIRNAVFMATGSRKTVRSSVNTATLRDSGRNSFPENLKRPTIDRLSSTGRPSRRPVSAFAKACGYPREHYIRTLILR